MSITSRTEARWQTIGCSQREELRVDIKGKTAATASATHFRPSKWTARVGDVVSSGTAPTVSDARHAAELAIRDTLEAVFDLMSKPAIAEKHWWDR